MTNFTEFMDNNSHRHFIEECITGTNLILSHLFLTTNALQAKTKEFKLLSFTSSCTNPVCSDIENPLPSNNESNKFEEVQHTKKLPCIVYVVPFYKPIDRKKDSRGDLYMSWKITDLRGNFGSLLIYDNAFLSLKKACIGELWGLINPGFFPLNNTESPLRRVFFVKMKHQIFRIGKVAYYSQCTSRTFSGGICNQPFENKPQDGIVAHPPVCPNHSRRFEQAMRASAQNEKANLEADGITVNSIPLANTGRYVTIISRSDSRQMKMERNANGKVKVVKIQNKSDHHDTLSEVLPQEEKALLMKKRVEYYEKNVLRHRALIDETSLEKANNEKELKHNTSESCQSNDKLEEEAAVNLLCSVKTFYPLYLKNPTEELEKQISRHLRALKLPNCISPALAIHIKDLAKILTQPPPPKRDALSSVLFLTKRRLKTAINHASNQCCTLPKRTLITGDSTLHLEVVDQRLTTNDISMNESSLMVQKDTQKNHQECCSERDTVSDANQDSMVDQSSCFAYSNLSPICSEKINHCVNSKTLKRCRERHNLPTPNDTTSESLSTSEVKRAKHSTS